MKLRIKQELARILKFQHMLAKIFMMIKTTVDFEREGNMTRHDCLNVKDILNIGRK
jgi:hypothetical protein